MSCFTFEAAMFGCCVLPVVGGSDVTGGRRHDECGGSCRAGPGWGQGTQDASVAILLRGRTQAMMPGCSQGILISSPRRGVAQPVWTAGTCGVAQVLASKHFPFTFPLG